MLLTVFEPNTQRRGSRSGALHDTQGKMQYLDPGALLEALCQDTGC